MSMLLALALMGQSGAAQALDCSELMTQSQMNQCADRDYRAADAQLNAQWRDTLAELRRRDADRLDRWDTRPGYAEQLLTAQRAWLAYRDAHCASEGYAARGGSMEPMLVSFCLRHLTEQRTAQLAALIDPER